MASQIADGETGAVAHLMSQALVNGSLVDAVIAITLLEALALLVYRQLTGKGVAASQFLLNLLSGLSLMVALRLVLAGAWWGAVAGCLLLAGVLHMADLWRRWER